MAAIIDPNHRQGNTLREWPMAVTATLIRRRRHHKNEFFITRTRDQWQIWDNIANYIFNVHFINVTYTQCRTKWNALVSGYENLKRLNNDNPDRYRTFTPSFYDYEFYHEMSSEFWIDPGNYLFN